LDLPIAANIFFTATPPPYTKPIRKRKGML
jgi:hypothetical protein